MADPPTEPLDRALAAVRPTACHAFGESLGLLTGTMHQIVIARADLPELLGICSVDTLADLSAAQSREMATHLCQGSADALIGAVTDAYRAQLSAGIAPRYLPIALAAWIESVARHLPGSSAQQINAVYQCLLDVHWWLLLLAHAPEGEGTKAHELAPYYQRYVQALLKPDAAEALLVSAEYITDVSRLPIWWEQIIQPAMYEIGHLWASGSISVGQEQIATSITQRVIAWFYPLILSLPRDRGAVVVAASPNELHQIGPRILADLLEMNGWDVHYTGAGATIESVVSLVQEVRAVFVCISTTLVSSIPAAANLIFAVRATCQPIPQILVGGQAYRTSPQLWQRVGADGFASSAREGIRLLDRLAAPGSPS